MDTLCVGCDNRSGNTGASIARTFLLFLLVEGARGRMVDARNLPFFDFFFVVFVLYDFTLNLCSLHVV